MKLNSDGIRHYDRDEKKQYSGRRDNGHLHLCGDRTTDEAAEESTAKHKKPIETCKSATNSRSSKDWRPVRIFEVGDKEIQLSWNTDLNTHIEENGNDAKETMTESKRAALINDLLAIFFKIRLGDGNKVDDDK